MARNFDNTIKKWVRNIPIVNKNNPVLGDDDATGDDALTGSINVRFRDILRRSNYLRSFLDSILTFGSLNSGNNPTDARHENNSSELLQGFMDTVIRNGLPASNDFSNHRYTSDNLSNIVLINSSISGYSYQNTEVNRSSSTAAPYISWVMGDGNGTNTADLQMEFKPVIAKAGKYNGFIDYYLSDPANNTTKTITGASGGTVIYSQVVQVNAFVTRFYYSFATSTDNTVVSLIVKIGRTGGTSQTMYHSPPIYNRVDSSQLFGYSGDRSVVDLKGYSAANASDIADLLKRISDLTTRLDNAFPRTIFTQTDGKFFVRNADGSLPSGIASGSVWSLADQETAKGGTMPSTPSVKNHIELPAGDISVTMSGGGGGGGSYGVQYASNGGDTTFNNNTATGGLGGIGTGPVGSYSTGRSPIKTTTNGITKYGEGSLGGQASFDRSSGGNADNANGGQAGNKVLVQMDVKAGDVYPYTIGKGGAGATHSLAFTVGANGQDGYIQATYLNP